MLHVSEAVGSCQCSQCWRRPLRRHTRTLGSSLHWFSQEAATPVLTSLEGRCHLYVGVNAMALVCCSHL